MIKITINTENDAFEGIQYGAEVARILREIARDYDTYGKGAKSSYNDINGNKVASVNIE